MLFKGAVLNCSIVIPSYNSHQYIDVAISSIVRSPCVREILVMDNRSVDGTLQYLQSLQLRNILVYSQDDSGPAQALNSGFKKASSEIIGWLNSDDYYSEGAIERAVSAFEANPNLKILYGLGAHVNAAGEHLGLYPTLPPTTNITEFSNGSFICQPTVFFRRELFTEVGLLDESLKTAFDMDFWLRIFLYYSPNQIGFINQIQAYSRLHDQCITRKFRLTVALESMQLIAKYLGKAPGHWILTYFNEVCESYPFVGDLDSLSEHFERILSTVASFMERPDFDKLSNKLKTDYRLCLSSPQFFVSTLPDGWVSESVVIKLRYVSGGIKAMRLECCGNWPVDSTLHLQIMSSDGILENLSVSSCENFEIELHAELASADSFFYWTISTAQFFIPANLEAGSNDQRKLSFKVKGAWALI